MKTTSVITILLFVLIARSPAYSQRGLYLLGGLEVSGLNDYKFQQKGNVLQRGIRDTDGFLYTGVGFSLNAALHYRFSKHFAVETGYQFSEMDLAVYDSHFFRKNNLKSGGVQNNVNGFVADQGNFDFAKWYYSNYISASYFMASRSKVQPYVNAGIAYNYFSSSQGTFSGSYTYFPSQPQPGGGRLVGSPLNRAGEQMQITAHYSPNYTSGFVEIGLFFHRLSEFHSKNKGPYFFVGLKRYVAGNMLSGEYQNVQNGITLYTDKVMATGGYTAFTLRFGGTLISKKDKRTQPHAKHYHYKYPHSLRPKAKTNDTYRHHSKQSGSSHVKRKKSKIPKPAQPDTDNTRGW